MIVSGGLLTRGHHRFYPCPLQEGRGLVYHWGWLGWHRERAFCSPVTLSADTPFLFGGCHCCSYFRSEGMYLRWYCCPAWDIGLSPSTGRHVYKAWPRAAASFTATASSLLPHYELVGPCHEGEVTSWGVWYMIPCPLASHVAQPLYMVGVSGFLRRVVRGWGKVQS